jgi:hypothetical protein
MTLDAAPSPFLGWSPADLFAVRGAPNGWTKTRVPNPFLPDRPGDTKTVVLHRCPEHAGVLLRAIRVRENTYDIILKTDEKAGDQ